MTKNKILTITLNPSIDKTIELADLQIGGLNRIVQSRQDIGGKGINAAKVLSVFGSEVVASGIIAGEQGGFILRELENLQIESHFLETEGETRTNYKLVDTDAGVTTEVNEKGFWVREEVLGKYIEMVEGILGEISVMILAGSIAQGIDDDIYYKLIQLAHEHHVRVILDADGERLRKGIEANPWVMKPNLFELSNLRGSSFNSNMEAAEYAEKLIRNGLEMIVVSLGKDGALYIGKDVRYWAKPFQIEPQSTVGAGDSMVAVIAYMMQKQYISGEKYAFEELAKMTTAAGSITASKAGTTFCTKEEVLRYKDQIELVEI